MNSEDQEGAAYHSGYEEGRQDGYADGLAAGYIRGYQKAWGDASKVANGWGWVEKLSPLRQAPENIPSQLNTHKNIV